MNFESMVMWIVISINKSGAGKKKHLENIRNKKKYI